QALTTGGQEKNPAAWYYLGRYYILTNDAPGMDSAFNKTEALKPDCKTDTDFWRRYLWVPTFNAGVAAWQANNTDSAIASFRRAACSCSVAKKTAHLRFIDRSSRRPIRWAMCPWFGSGWTSSKACPTSPTPQPREAAAGRRRVRFARR